MEGFTGQGTTKRIKAAYQYLIKHYKVGDQIYLFGFSHGAFAARSLAGLIRNCGILQIKHLNRIDQAFDIYRSVASDKHPDSPDAIAFRKQYAVANRTPIHFIGVWDTVGALGNPFAYQDDPSNLEKFHDTKLSSTVKHAYQALAINERRKIFQPCLWQQSSKDYPHQTVEQRWFIGAHANIGGGYANPAISNHTLKWMVEKAQHAGLNFHLPFLEQLDYDAHYNNNYHVYDETLNPIQSYLSMAERPIGLVDSRVNIKYLNIHTHEILDDLVLPIFTRKIQVSWSNVHDKMNELAAYVKRHRLIEKQDVS